MTKPIRIAIASGKGGTGKTTIATNLAIALAGQGAAVAYVDCDVEEPNGHIFLRPSVQKALEVSIPVPEVDAAKCTLCGACGQACRYSAIVVLPKKVLTFPKLCHGCGGCLLACPEGAIHEVPRVTGIVEQGVAGPVAFLHGTLNVGEAMAPPVIRAVLDAAPKEGTLVLDAPPGTSCPVIETVKRADVVLLVTEPTPFGLNDLKLAVEMVRELSLPFAVAVNRAGTGDMEVYQYCAAEQIPIVLEIHNDRAIAHAYSRGVLAIEAVPSLRPLLAKLHRELGRLARTVPTRPVRAVGAGISSSEPVAPLPSQRLPPGPHKDVPELVVISGKGGTGKTSIVASLFALAGRAAVADCDVDAADLHLVLAPRILQRWNFSGGKSAVIDAALCASCGICAENCRFEAIHVPAIGEASGYEVDPIACEGCGVCADTCPAPAVSMVSSRSGAWFVSDTRHGPMTHARLGIAQENSGKLVSLVRREARAEAILEQRELLVCDGSPGIGCPVIASIAGARMVLIVTEPTLSGLHDLERVAELCAQFGIKAAICINKADINPEIAAQIEAEAARRAIPVLGRVGYDESVTEAQVKRMAVVEVGDGIAAKDIKALWEGIQELLFVSAPRLQ